MKRSLIVLCAAALLATLPLASVAEAGRHGRHGRRGRPGWPNRTTSYRRANPANRGSQGWQGWRGWRDCQGTQPEEVMVEIWHVIAYSPEDAGIAFGELMEVPESEVEAHLDHGDITVGDDIVLWPLDDGLRDFFEGQYLLRGIVIDLSNAQVYFYL